MKKITIGILAHVDAGKTTLSEAMLYESGTIRKAGRVDDGDALLDTFELEKKRGITIFSKQAVFSLADYDVMLLDTPGHVDFSAEMERTLQVLDYAILVISGADGVQGHTKTLWRLLKQYDIPVFLFVNKMDQPGTDKVALMDNLHRELGGSVVDFSQQDMAFYDELAMCDEEAMEQFLENETIGTDHIRQMIETRLVFPCYFGSALKINGVREFMEGLNEYMREPLVKDEFGARIFKIIRDDQGNRLTYMKITGGSLKVKDTLSKTESDGSDWTEKVNQIRLYSGEKYQTLEEATAGMVCAVTGLTFTRPGDGLGSETEVTVPILEPILTYRIDLPEEVSPAVMMPKLKLLEEEEPELHIVWDENLGEIQAQIMGEVQLEILRDLILQRFDVIVKFGSGNIVYKETIENTVEGVGHFEPLRHYAEVHLQLEPGERGSGLVFAADCSEDILDKNWQRLILTHLEEREHPGVLTGSSITDMKITLVTGRAHLKHTEGGDFRQATYRAVRQGLMQAHCVLLEPYYKFTLEVPTDQLGRAMADIDRMKGTFTQPDSVGDMAVLTGEAPVSTMRGYGGEVTAYTHGTGKLFCLLNGYQICHNEEEVVRDIGYDPEADVANPTGSVFCAHGSGFVVSWDKVPDYMHLETSIQEDPEEEKYVNPYRKPKEEIWVGTEEIDQILDRTFHANKKSGFIPHKGINRRTTKTPTVSPVVRKASKNIKKDQYLLVDGYNIVFAWDELKELAAVNIDGARGALMDELCNYQGMHGMELIVVFDAYRVKNHPTEITDYHNIHVVYTKEAETADQYIEKFAHENGHKYDITVATSDGLEQMIITGAGCRLLSAREFKVRVEEDKARMRSEFIKED